MTPDPQIHNLIERCASSPLVCLDPRANSEPQPHMADVPYARHGMQHLARTHRHSSEYVYLLR